MSGRSGPVGAHPIERGTARTLAGSARSDANNYTGVKDPAYLLGNAPLTRHRQPSPKKSPAPRIATTASVQNRTVAPFLEK